MTTMTAIGAKLVELFRDTNSWVLPNKDFIIISDTSDIEEIEQKANELFPEGNLGDPWTMDDISHEITGATDNWGYADEWTYCAHCYKPINMYGSYYLPESWFDPETGDTLCACCVEEEFPEDYLEFLVNNPDEENIFLSTCYLKESGYTLLDIDSWPIDTKQEVYNELRNEYAEIVFGKRDVRFSVKGFTVWVK